MYKEINEEYVTCPFNPSHQVQRLRIQGHILKCRKNYPDAQLATCYYNFRHLVRAENMSKHLETCLDKIRLEGSRYRDQSVTASTSTFVVDDDDDDKTESVISFGADFKKCLPSNASSSSSSTLTSRRGNALLKTGPRGNLGRYATKQRKTELQDKELYYLESYDGLQNYEPSSPEDSPPKNKFDFTQKDDSDEDMQPLPLPKTSSKAFTSLKRSLFDEAKNNVPKEKNLDKSIGADKKHKSDKPVKSKYVMEYEKEYGEEAEKDFQAFISHFEEKKAKKKPMPFIQWKAASSTHIVGRGNWSATETDRKPGKKKHFSLLPDVSDLDDEVPKRKNKTKYQKGAKFSDDDTLSSDNDSIIPELEVYGEIPPNSFMYYRDNTGEDSSDTETAVSSASSVIARKNIPLARKNQPVRREEEEDEEEDEETFIMNTSLGRGFPCQKRENIKPFRGMGRGVLSK